MVRVTAEPSRAPPRVLATRPTPVTRNDYPISLKRQICRLCEAHPTLTTLQLVDLIYEQLGFRIPASTLNRIRAERDRWFTTLHLERRRLRVGLHQDLEDALLTWAHHWLEHNGAITYALLQAQAMEVGRTLNIHGFGYSQGWVNRFCRRHGLALRRRVGEAASANMANVELARNSIPMALANLRARPQDVFNSDETSIILGAQQFKTLAFSRVSGVKKQIDGITIMLCCNATGDERLKLLMVAKPKRPRCFSSAREGTSFTPGLFMHYFGHPCAWSTRTIFNTWLLRVQADMIQSNRTIFLLLDNASVHDMTIQPCTEELMHGLKVLNGLSPFHCSCASICRFMEMSINLLDCARVYI